MNFIKKNVYTLICIGIAINLLLILYIVLFKKDAVDLEILKAGGSENFNLVQQLYQNPTYQQQQTTAIQQALDSFSKQATK